MLVLGRNYNPGAKLFNNFFEGEFEKRHLKRNNLPATNIVEKEKEFLLDLAIPGLNKEDFKIMLEKDVLNISTESKEENSSEMENYTRKEFNYSSFCRSFIIPETVDIEKISGKYENGILKMVLPKKEEAQMKLSKEIKIS